MTKSKVKILICFASIFLIGCRSIYTTSIANDSILVCDLTLAIVKAHNADAFIIHVDSTANVNTYLYSNFNPQKIFNIPKYASINNTFPLSKSDIRDLQKWIENKDLYKYETDYVMTGGYEFFVFVNGELISHELDFIKVDSRNRMLTSIKPHEPTERLVEILTKYIGDYHLWEW